MSSSDLSFSELSFPGVYSAVRVFLVVRFFLLCLSSCFFSCCVFYFEKKNFFFQMSVFFQMRALSDARIF